MLFILRSLLKKMRSRIADLRSRIADLRSRISSIAYPIIRLILNKYDIIFHYPVLPKVTHLTKTGI
jgi:hypothetical protein